MIFQGGSKHHRVGLQGRHAQLGVLLVLFSFTLSGCFVNHGTSNPVSRRNSSEYSDSPGSGSTFGLTISRVFRSSHDAEGSFEVLGDGSGKLGRTCANPQDTTANLSTLRPCVCIYTFQTTGGSSSEMKMDSVYSEADLVRCPSSGLPNGIKEVRLRITESSQGLSSNELLIDTVSGTGSSENLHAMSFTSVKRYQCRDAVFIPLATDSRIYDPILSEDPEYSYPLNYYASNLANAITSFVSNSSAQARNGAGYLCPSIPNDPAAGTNLAIYSVAALNGSKRIYPDPTGENKRTEFYVSKAKTSLFNVPLNAYLAPNTITREGQSNAPDPLGYGAAPVIEANGLERCPSYASLPTGYQWVKVWLFRASLAARQVATSEKLRSLGVVSCNPGHWPNTTTPVIGGCLTSGENESNSNVFGRRYLQHNNRCFDVTSGAQRNIASLPFTSPMNQNGKTYYGDTWTQRGTAICGTSGYNDLLGQCNNPKTVPRDTTPSMTQVDSSSRYDFLFVVTPQDIYASDFRNETSRSLPYTPYRFYSQADCTAADPDAAGCPTNRVISYGVKFHDVGTNGDAPAGEAGRRSVFPLCALQPISGANP